MLGSYSFVLLTICNCDDNLCILNTYYLLTLVPSLVSFLVHYHLYF